METQLNQNPTYAPFSLLEVTRISDGNKVYIPVDKILSIRIDPANPAQVFLRIVEAYGKKVEGVSEAGVLIISGDEAAQLIALMAQYARIRLVGEWADS